MEPAASLKVNSSAIMPVSGDDAPSPRSPMWAFLEDFVGPEVYSKLKAEAVSEYHAMDWAAKHAIMTVVVSGLETTVSLQPRGLERFYLPFILLLKQMTLVGAASGKKRIFVGLSAAAGAGKTTTSQILRALYDNWFASHGSGQALSAVISMDAFHRYNSDLISCGLKGHKGRIDTIDAVKFAACLEQVHRAGQASEAVSVPEYDRRVTHDPVEGATLVASQVELVLVEGLYLCSGGTNNSAVPSDLALPPADNEQAAAWIKVRGLLDAVFYLDVPLQECRERVVARKVLGGVSKEDSEAYFERVDYPTFRRLKDVDARKPPPAVSLLFSTPRIKGDDRLAEDDGCGPDITLTLVDRELRSIRLHRRATSTSTAAADSFRPAAVDTCVVLGLNPCVQRTLIFGEVSKAGPDGSAALIRPGGGWKRGQVNRAHTAFCSFGGKGQHAALAFATSAAFASVEANSGVSIVASARPLPSAVLYQFTSGDDGKRMQVLLERRVAEVASKTSCPGESLPLEIRNFDFSAADGPSNTRTCTTLVDLSAGAGDAEGMTELIEPSSPVPGTVVSALENDIMATMSDRSQRKALVIMGTAPPGAASVYADVLSGIARMDPTARPFVLLDLASGALPLLSTGAVTMLKVNRSELATIAADLCATAAGGATAKLDHVGQVQTLLASLPSLAVVAVTDGPSSAFLYQRTSRGFAAWSYELPKELPRPTLNPIGAGDTVAGVFLQKCLVEGRSAVSAYQAALAAASASCCSFLGADWEAKDAAWIQQRILTRIEGGVWL